MNLSNIENLSITQIINEVILSTPSRHTRECKSLSDYDFVFSCIQRVIQSHSTGREFIQALEEVNKKQIPKTTFFDSLHSPRRLSVIEDVCYYFQKNLSTLVSKLKVNHLAKYKELDIFDIYSADGHFISHSSHTKSENNKKKAVAAGNIYACNMKTGVVSLFETVSDGSKKNHEMTIFKEKFVDSHILQDGKKPIIMVLDRAYTNHRFWNMAKQNGVYMVTRSKTSHAFMFCGQNNFNAKDPINKGILSDRLGGFQNSSSIVRVIEYKDPETEEIITFISTLPHGIKPGLIARLYFHRWGIEKVFDNFKNSFKEKKAWAHGYNALKVQGQAITFSYNLILFLLEKVKVKNKVEDLKCKKKYQDWLKKRRLAAKQKNRSVQPFLFHKRKVLKISEQIIRVFRNHLFSKTTLFDLSPLLVKRLEAYL